MRQVQGLSDFHGEKDGNLSLCSGPRSDLILEGLVNLKKMKTGGGEGLYEFTFPPTVQECSLFSTSSPAFIACRFLDRRHSDWCEVVPHCGFDLRSLFISFSPVVLNVSIIGFLAVLLLCTLM